MATSDDWSRAYARQADAEARDALIRSGTPRCQELHFLQMACEKLAKAHLCAAGTDAASLQSSHAYIAKVVPIVLRERLSQTGRDRAKSRWKLVAWALLAREIELLAPAVDDGGRRPDNAEYPWANTGGSIMTPAEHDFPNLRMLSEPIGREFLKLIKASIDDLV